MAGQRRAYHHRNGEAKEQKSTGGNMLILELGMYWGPSIAPSVDRKRKKRKIRDLDLGIIPQGVVVKEVEVDEKRNKENTEKDENET